jgi:hypothetical protein
MKKFENLKMKQFENVGSVSDSAIDGFGNLKICVCLVVWGR